jgi:hypothetical protein
MLSPVKKMIEDQRGGQRESSDEPPVFAPRGVKP